MRYITLVEMRLTSRAVTKLVIWCHRVSAPLRELRSWTFTLTTGAELYRTRRVNRRAWIHKFRGFPKRSRNHFAPKQAAIMKLASGYLLQKSQDTLLHPERCCALGKSLLANVPFFFLCGLPCQKGHWGQDLPLSCSHDSIGNQFLSYSYFSGNSQHCGLLGVLLSWEETLKKQSVDLGWWVTFMKFRIGWCYCERRLIGKPETVKRKERVPMARRNSRISCTWRRRLVWDYCS